MLSLLRKLWGMLDASERRRSFGLGLLMLITGLLEISGLISVVPLVTVLTSGASPCARLGGAAGEWCGAALPGSPAVLAVLVFLLIAGSNALAFLVVWWSSRLSWTVWRRLATRAFEIALHRPYETFFSSHSAAVVRNVVHETERLSLMVLMPLLVVLSRVVVAACIVGLVLVVDPGTALIVVLAFAALYALVYRQLQGRVRDSGNRAYQAREQIGRTVTEAIGGIREVRLLGCGPHFHGNFDRSAADLARQYVYGNVVSVVPRYLIETAAFVLVMGLAVYLGRAAGGWQSAAPLLAFYVFAAYRLLPQFQQIYANAMLLQQNARVVDEVAALLVDPHGTASTALDAPSMTASPPGPPVRFEGVSYAYPGAARPVFESLDLVIEPRSTIGLVGKTGAGKSTLIDLLAGLIRPTAGRITLDGVPLDVGNEAAWRARLGYVPQANFLLDDSIRRNIAFGQPDDAVDQGRIEQAARMANIHEFVRGLPQGYDTPVGERGVRLSGGQRQRLAIARALYRDPEVLIFDEATSALDQETEQAIMEAIRLLSHQKTLVIVSHRPATLQWCDRIYELADGRLRPREVAAA